MGKSDHSLYNVIWAYSNYVIKKIYVYAYKYMYATTINKKQVMILKENKEYMGGFGRQKWKREMV